MSMIIAPTVPVVLERVVVEPPPDDDLSLIENYNIRDGQYYYNDIPLYVVQKDDPPRYNVNLKCPPMVQTAFNKPSSVGGTVWTPMNVLGWDRYIQKLNGDKWLDAVGNTLAMFNHPDSWEDGGTNMESLWFGLGAVVGAVESEKFPFFWAELILPNYRSGPHPDLPTYWESPFHAQRFTAICREGGVILHKNDFCYPSTCKYPVFMRWSMLKPWTINMGEYGLITRPVSVMDLM